MNRTEAATKLEAIETTIAVLQEQAEALRAELAEPQAATETASGDELTARENSKLINDLNAVLGTEVHVLMGVGRTRNGHGGAKAAQTRKINKLVKSFTAEQLAAGIEELKSEKLVSRMGLFHFAADARGNEGRAEANVACRLGIN